jgi:hypothetical protein
MCVRQTYPSQPLLLTTLQSFVHIQDVGIGKSKEEKTMKAVKHFNYYCNQRNYPKDFESIEYDDITEDLIGKYAH